MKLENYIRRLMPQLPSTLMNTELIFELEKKIDALISICDRLQQENKQLKASQKELEQEHEQLCEKNAQARNRVDNMISRLRSLEQDT